MGREEAAEQLAREEALGDGGDAEAERAARLAAPLPHSVERCADLCQCGPDAGMKRLTRLGQPHAAGGALDELHAEPVLEPPERLADR